MESLQKQILVIAAKIDAVQQVVEQLNQKVTEAFTDPRWSANSSQSSVGMLHRQLHNAALTHKDVLVDNHQVETNSQSSERQLSPEIQIQRLTAQLTAAYNRIADLEENLLARRIH